MAQTAEREISTSVIMPISLRERARGVAKSLRTTFSELVRDSLRERLDNIIEIEHARKEKDQKIKDEKVATRKQRLQVSTLIPVTPPQPIDQSVDSSISTDDNAVYQQHAVKVAEAYAKDPQEARLLFAECVGKIKKHFPFTHPPDKDIERRLEALVRTQVQQPQQPTEPSPAAPEPTQQFDHLVGRTVDTTKTKTSGTL